MLTWKKSAHGCKGVIVLSVEWHRIISRGQSSNHGAACRREAECKFAQSSFQGSSEVFSHE